MPIHCPRCGGRYLDDPRFCSACMDGEADLERAREILDAAAAGNREALRMLSLIDDTRATDVVLAAADHPQAEIRRALLVSLGVMGERRAEPIAIRALGDPDDRVRAAAIECLAELGGPSVAGALAGHMAHPGERVAAAIALAWLRDGRAVEPLLAAVDQETFSRNIRRAPAAALAWLADPSTVPSLARVLERMADRWVASRPPPGSPPRPDWGAHRVATDVAMALKAIGGADAEAAVAGAQERFDGGLPLHFPIPPDRRPFAYHAPPDPRRTIPRWALELQPAALPVREPVTKFGGQPVWLDAPTWPVAADEGPMTFMAQFAVPGVDGLAYLFIDPSPLELIDSSDPGFAGSLFMQPGPPPPRYLPQASGPTYASEVDDDERFELRLTGRLTEYVPTLEEGPDYPDWEAFRAEPPDERDDDRDWNKIGGSPRYLQNGPPPGEWRFLFQFTAGHVGHEMGDGAECYGLIDPDRRGLFLVESH